MLLSMPYVNNRGFVLPLLPILTIIIFCIGFIVYKSLPINEPQATPEKGFLGMSFSKASLSPTPSPTSSVLSTSRPSATPLVTPKPSVTTNLSPVTTTSPNQTAQPSQTPQPTQSPTPDVYRLDSLYSEIRLPVTAKYGHGVAVVLKDSNGNVVADQKDFNFIWKIDDSSFLLSAKAGTAGDMGSCSGSAEIKAPCPNNTYSINHSGVVGKTMLHVQAQYVPTGKIVAQRDYLVEVYN